MLNKWNVTGLMECCNADLCNNHITNTSHSTSTSKIITPSPRGCTKSFTTSGIPKLVPDHLIAMNEDKICNVIDDNETATDKIIQNDASKRQKRNTGANSTQTTIPSVSSTPSTAPSKTISSNSSASARTTESFA